MKRIATLCAAVLVGAALLVPARTAADNPKPKNIDIVICLDISGSMNGLLNSARSRLWDIVNELAKAQPTPVLRVALYSYGGMPADGYHPKAGWVRKDVDLTTDLDLLYQKLFALKSRGSVEYVARVCNDAIRDQKWAGEKDSLKIIFVAGNEPASQDPTIKLKEVADLAKAKDIIINPIFCGNAQHSDARDWIDFAAMSGGKFASIDMNRSVVVASTPFDQKLLELNNKTNATYLSYGKMGKAKALNQVAQDQNAYAAGKDVALSRIAARNTALYRCEEWDLVEKCKTDPKFDITKVAAEELPEAMRKMTGEQRIAHVKKMTDERIAIQKQIADLNAKRDVYIREQQRKTAGTPAQVFDRAIRETLRLQAAPRGIKIPE